MSYTLHVVSHTHWDREWYFPYQRFRLRLVDLIDHLLDILDTDPDFIHFNLDAQTIVLEDYLELRPSNRARLERYIREGKIAIGPWYQLNDEFLVSGESTVRSLLEGHRIAEQFGAVQKIGYLPDQFGNISQMPQIFRGFGIDNAIMGRGYQLTEGRKMEFDWVAPDGSAVLSSLMAFWYNNAQTFPSDTEEAVQYAEQIKQRMEPHSLTHHLLLMNGVDHLEAQPDIGKILKKIQPLLSKSSGDSVVHDSLTNYITSVRREVETHGGALETWKGELREDRHGACLAGTLSARMYLKQMNHAAQISLEQYAERFASFARIEGEKYPLETLRFAWKLLMQNHPHDSICGCSTDETHQDMIPRFRQAKQVADDMAERAMNRLAGYDQTKGAQRENLTLSVFNPLNWSRTDPVRAILEFPLGEPTRGNPTKDPSRMVRGFKLIAPDGKTETPFAVLNTEVYCKMVLNPRELPLDQWVQKYEIEFIAKDISPCGYAAYKIQIENAMPIYPIQSEERMPSAYPVVFEDCGEVGDEYLHRKPMNDSLYHLRLGGSSYSEETNAVRRTFVYTQDWDLPKSKSKDGRSRSAERIICRITTRMTKWADIPRVEFETRFDNQAEDHRLRVRFENAYGLQFRPYSYAEGQYDVVERPIENPYGDLGGAPFHPQQFWTALVGEEPSNETIENAENTEQSMTIINSGLPEYEVYSNSEGVQSLTVTLLRCVGQLSGRGDGPGISTPDAQCKGINHFRYAWTISQGCWKGGMVWKQAHQFNVPMLAVQGNPTSTAPTTHTFVRVDPATLVVTAVKGAENGENLIVRFYNILDEEMKNGRISLPGAKRHRLVNMNEEPLEDWSGGDTFHMDVPSRRIVTVEFEL